MERNMQKTRKRDITSIVDPLMMINKFTNFNPFQAIVECIDNSIDAGAKKVNITYNPIDFLLTIQDDGCGMTTDAAEKAINYGFGKRKENKMGEFNIGLKMVAPFLIDTARTSVVKVRIDTVNDGHRTIIKKVYNVKDPMKYLNTEITDFDDDMPNGTKVEVSNAFISNKDLALVKNKIQARYCDLLKEKRIKIYFNYEPLSPIDMFYSHNNDTLINEAELTCEDDKGEFKVTVQVYDITKETKTNSKIGGFRNNVKEKMNELDKMEKSSTREKYRGVYFNVNGVNITLGGSENSVYRQIGFALNSISNGVRIKITIPDSRKEYVYFPFKTETNSYLKDHKRSDGGKVFGSVIDFIAKYNPTKLYRKEADEDVKKRTRNKFMNAVPIYDSLFAELKEVKKQFKKTEDLSESVAKLLEISEKLEKLHKQVTRTKSKMLNDKE